MILGFPATQLVTATAMMKLDKAIGHRTRDATQHVSAQQSSSSSSTVSVVN